MTPLLTGVFASQISGHLNTFTSTGSFDAITSYTVGAGGASTITFSGIPSGYKHLQIRLIYPTGDWGTLRFNDDSTSSNYRGHGMVGSGTSTGSSSTSANIIYEPTSSNGGGTNVYAGVIDILDYSSANKYKTTRSIEGYDYNGGGQIYFTSGLWMSTNPITKITMTRNTTNWAQYSQFALYGIKG